MLPPQNGEIQVSLSPAKNRSCRVKYRTLTCRFCFEDVTILSSVMRSGASDFRISELLKETVRDALTLLGYKIGRAHV